MKVYGKKVTALLLALCMVLGLAACGNGGDDTSQLSGTIYMPEYIDFNLDAEYINSGYCDGQNVYVIAEIRTETEPYVDPDTGESFPNYEYTTGIYRIPLDGGEPVKLENFESTPIPEGVEGSSNISNIRGGEDGTLWVTEDVYTTTFELPADFDPNTDDKWNYPSESTNSQILRQLDSTGNELSRIDTSGMQEKLGADYINSMVMDPEGYFYTTVQTFGETTSENKVVVLDKDQNVLFTIEEENLWGQLTLLGDGTVGMSYWREEDGQSSQVLRTIDKAAKGWGAEYPLPPNSGNIYTGSQKYIFYYDNGDSLYGFNKETKAGEKILSWSAANINKDELMFFTFLEDGRIVAMTRSWGMYGDDMTMELAILTETDASVLKDKVTLTYATQYLGYDERSKIIDFNKSSDKYRIEIKDYSEFNTAEDYKAGLTKLNTEIAAGNVPDILNVSGLPIQQYGAKGLLEDLWPYIDNDPDLGRDAIMENVFKAAEQDGKLYQVFSTFSIQTVVGATKVVGDRMSWTLDDLQAALATMPEGCTIFGVGDDLIMAKAAAHGAQLALQLLLLRVTAQGGLAPHEGGGNVVVAVETGHFLGQIGHPLHIAAPGGHSDLIAVHLEVQLAQDTDHLVSGYISTQQGVDLFRLEGQDGGLGNMVENVDDAIHHLAGAQHLYQLTGAVDGGQGVQGIKALFKLGAGLGTHAQGQGGLTDAGAVEVGGLEHHIHCVVHDLAVFAAHDAGQTYRTGIVGDDQHIVGELADIAVQGGQLLAVSGPADNDLTAFYIAVVKSVHGLAVFQHNIVCDVHDVVDRPHTHGAQPLPHPLGGGGDLHIADHTGGIPGAQLRVRGLHVQKIAENTLGAALHHRLVEAQLRVESGGSFPGQADDAETVGTIGGDLKFHHMVVKSHGGADILSHSEAGQLRVVGKNPDTILVGGGEIPLLQSQLLEGAEHTVGHLTPELALLNLHPAGQGGFVEGHRYQVALLDILSAGNDLDGGVLTHLYLADPHMVAVFVALDLSHPAHDHAADLRTLLLRGLHLGAGEGHSLREFLIIGLYCDKFTEPFSA